MRLEFAGKGRLRRVDRRRCGVVEDGERPRAQLAAPVPKSSPLSPVGAARNTDVSPGPFRNTPTSSTSVCAAHIRTLTWVMVPQVRDVELGQGDARRVHLPDDDPLGILDHEVEIAAAEGAPGGEASEAVEVRAGERDGQRRREQRVAWSTTSLLPRHQAILVSTRPAMCTGRDRQLAVRYSAGGSLPQPGAQVIICA